MPILSWYDNLADRELPRLTPILERLAYEEDVRKILRSIVVNNEVDPKLEQQYLHSHKRDHSQKVQDRNQGGSKGHTGKRQSTRYESADNRGKHQAIVNEQYKKKQGSEQETMELMIQKHRNQ